MIEFEAKLPQPEVTEKIIMNGVDVGEMDFVKKNHFGDDSEMRYRAMIRVPSVNSFYLSFGRAENKSDAITESLKNALEDAETIKVNARKMLNKLGDK